MAVELALRLQFREQDNSVKALNIVSSGYWMSDHIQSFTKVRMNTAGCLVWCGVVWCGVV
jgi:hypothetical protein